MTTARLGIAAFMLLALSTRTFAQNDHLKCYQMKDPLNLAAFVDLNSPQFGLDAGCKVSKAKYFCVPVEKTVVSAEGKKTHLPITPLPISGSDPGDRICYKVKCPEPFPPDTQVTDQFGTRTLGKFKASMFCTPAVKGTTFCGDGMVADAENCDGASLNGATCTGLGFTAGGTLACTGECTYDTHNCACAPASTCENGFPATGQLTTQRPGDDGDIHAGAPLTYQDNGDGTLTDLNTALMWEKLSRDGSVHDLGNAYTWEQAFTDHVATLNGMHFAGYNDWRVPNVKELVSIVNFGNVMPSVSAAFNNNCVPGCNILTCSCTAGTPGPESGSLYWSCTSYADNPTTLAWGVGFGDYDYGLRVDECGVSTIRPVRGGLAGTAGKCARYSVRAVRVGG